MGREFGFGWTAVSRENGVGVLAQAFKLSHAARGYPVAANEAERQAQIHQLDDQKELLGSCFICRSRSKNRSPLRTSWWKVRPAIARPSRCRFPMVC